MIGDYEDGLQGEATHIRTGDRDVGGYQKEVMLEVVPMERLAAQEEDGSRARATVGCHSDATMLVGCESATEGTTLPVNLPSKSVITELETAGVICYAEPSLLSVVMQLYLNSLLPSAPSIIRTVEIVAIIPFTILGHNNYSVYC